jgi:hypothetical protein
VLARTAALISIVAAQHGCAGRARA